MDMRGAAMFSFIPVACAGQHSLKPLGCDNFRDYLDESCRAPGAGIDRGQSR